MFTIWLASAMVMLSSFQELGEEIGWEILEMRQLLRFLKDFLKKNAKKFGGFKIK